MDTLVISNVHLFDDDFSPELVLNSLSTIRYYWACGTDPVSSGFLFLLKQPLSAPLSLGFGALFRESVLPNDWLEAINGPVFKMMLTSDPNNNRPISLTYIACRVMEEIFKGVILIDILNQKLINRSQHVFSSPFNY